MVAGLCPVQLYNGRSADLLHGCRELWHKFDYIGRFKIFISKPALLWSNLIG